MKRPWAALILGLLVGFGLAWLIRSEKAGSIRDRVSAGGLERLMRDKGGSRSLDFSEAPSLAELESLMGQARDRASKARLTLAIYKLNAEQIYGVMNELREKIDSGRSDRNTYNLQTQLIGVWMELNAESALGWIDSMASMNIRQNLYSTALSALAESKPHEALAYLSNIPGDISRSRVEQSLMWSLAQSDPDVAFEFYQSNPDVSENTRMNFLSSIASQKIDQVIPELEKMGDAVERSSWAARNIFQSWAAQDIEAVKAYIDSTESEVLKMAAIEAAAGQLAKKDPAAAIAMAQSLGAKDQAKGMQAVYSTWMDREPEAALASLAGIDNSRLRDKICEEIVDHINWQNPKGAVAVIAVMEDGSAKNDAIRQMRYSVRQQPFDEQEALIRQLPEADRGPFLAGMASEMVRRDVERGTQVYLEMSEKDRAGNDGQQFLGELSRIDPDRAFELANELPNAAAKNSAISSIVNNLSNSSPETAAAYLEQLKGGQKDQAITSLARNWAEKDSDAALKWAQGLSGDQRVQAMASVSAQQAEHSPTEASKVFESALASAPEGMAGKLQGSAQRIAENYAKEDGAAAAQWALSLGQESVAKGAVSSTVQVWAQKDLVAASEWTNALDDGPIRDSAVQPIVKRLQNEEPAAAIEWAASMADEGSRKNTIRSALSNWYSNDPEAARRGLDNAGLDQKTHDEMLKVFE
ncbi:hypothetical protein ACFQY0_09650 [Haloferula chungangensis]|uniref:HEAT repeat domain-containing protein n=1 Tax=Haloferula chungangensis TaxID=1048331 RepID=A0ABW2L818_9BACT